MSKGLHFQLFHLDLLHLSNLLFPGGLLLLHKDSIPLGHTPVVRTGHCRAEWPSTCRLHVLPVSSPCSCPHPGLGVHLTASWLLSPSLLCKLFSHCSDVIRLKPAATA